MGSTLRIRVDSGDPAIAPPPFVLPRPLDADVRRLARIDATVLLAGESGTGKSRIAQHMHELGPRADAPFRRIDCAALNGALLESEVFGHRKGAFTGAVRDRQGLIRSADRGTLFLDEISVLDVGSQGRFLTLLEEARVRPVGGDRSESADVRIISATNDDLAGLVEDGRFREDLYFRCSQVVLRVPPLRERDDFEEVVRRGVWAVVRGAFRLAEAEVEITGGAVGLLEEQDWPGNIRELKHVVTSALLASGFVESPRVKVERRYVAEALASRSPLPLRTSPSGTAHPGGPTSSYAAPDDPSEERASIVRAMRRTAGIKKRAAELLAMGRTTLYEKLDRYRIEEEEWMEDAE